MKNITYILLLILGVTFLNSCSKDDRGVDQIEGSNNLAVFNDYTFGLKALADGSEYEYQFEVKVTGPSMKNLTSDITITLASNEASTASEGQHYRLPEKTITLTKSNNYLGLVDITVLTAGNTPPIEGTAAFDAYSNPVLLLDIVSAEGDASVISTGKAANISLNITAPNPFEGIYDVEMRYFHPTASGSHPSMGSDFDSDDPYGGIRISQKEWVAVTGTKCELGFAVWGDTDLCWIKVNGNDVLENGGYGISFEVDDTWEYDVKLGNPFDASQVSYYDPETRVISMYYHYSGAGGDRIFWEIFTPTFK
ncbi:MAG: hypothetical protein PF517_11950 [Salinivirgaceae bacterium]|jgi:hypothetical protein|nr:hypothetical protein [Salinivirgaceae bacterium]